LAGKTVTFTVCLKEIKTKELPELDDAFVQEISEFQTVAELREHLQKRLEQDALRQSEENLETAILNAILETTEVDLPETLVEQETTQLLARSLQSLQQQQGVTPGEIRKFLSQLPPETLNQLMERHRPEAINRLRRTLALSAIVRQEQIAVGPNELEVEVEEVMAAYAQQGQKLDRERVRQAVHEDLLANKVMAWLKSQTTVNWVDSEGNPTEPPTLSPRSEGEDRQERSESARAGVPETEFEAEKPEGSAIPEAVEPPVDAKAEGEVATEPQAALPSVEAEASGIPEAVEPSAEAATDPAGLQLEQAVAETPKAGKKSKKDK
jgi:trigger factor